MNNSQKSVLGIILIVILVAVGGIYYFILQSKNNQTASTSQSTSGGDFLSIITPTYDDLLESGKPFTVVFTPVNGASSYEITITSPAYSDKARNLGSGDAPNVLLKEIVKQTSYTITVPNSQAYYVTSSTYNGERLTVRALDKQGNTFNAVSRTTFHGKVVESSRPAVDSQQISILPLPTQPKLLDADTYVIGREGGTITLSFGALPSTFKTRKMTLLCYGPKVTIDSAKCPEGDLTFGSTAFTKKLFVEPNKGEGDSSFAIRVQYFDAEGNEPNPQGLDDESWISFKIKR